MKRHIFCVKKILALVFVLVLAVSLSVVEINTIAEAHYESEDCQKIYSDVAFDDDFDEDSIIVILDNQTSEINKCYENNFFGDIGAESIVDLTVVDNSLIDTINVDSFEQILQVNLSSGTKENVIETIEKLEDLDGVKYAGPNRFYSIEYTPNDPIYNNADIGQWALDKIDAEFAWEIETGSDAVRVGIIDTGIGDVVNGQVSHPDLSVESELGGDFVNMINDNTPGSLRSDQSGHGTHVAGIVGAIGNNGIGITGINHNVSLVPLQVGNSDGTISSAACVRAINYASNTWNTSDRISVLNMSIGGYNEWPEIETAIRQYPGLFVCSTGNTGGNNDSTHHYPSFYGSELHSNPLENLISVGRSDSNDQVPLGANRGAQTVSLFAPGQNIVSTYPTSMNSDLSVGYRYNSGSSMAAPHVTGVASLLLAYDSSLTTSEIKDAILNNVDYVAAMDGLCVTNGRLNAYEALKSIANCNELVSDIGYQGSDFAWLGFVDAVFDGTEDEVWLEDNTIFVTDESILKFLVGTKTSNNALLGISGEIAFELTDSNGQVIQNSICDVQVDIWNNVVLTGNIVQIDTDILSTGIYLLNITSSFSRGTWEDSDTYSFSIAINRPFTIMDGFGYNTSWYKWNGRVDVSSDALYMFANDLNGLTLMGDIPVVFTVKSDFAYNAWTQISGSITFTLKDSNGNVVPINGSNSHVANVTVGLVSNVTISNGSFSISGSDLADGSYTLTLNCTMSKGDTTYNTSDTYSFYVQNALCVAEDTLITLADGTQKEVEDLTGNEELLVWNLLTGEFDSAPILFVDSDAPNLYQVIELHFSDGTTVDVIGEHAFWSVEQNEYVFLRNDAAQYIGDSFMKRTINGFGVAEMTEVELVDVIVETEYTTAWSPVTYGHLCYYVNGMLSMPGATEGLINIFEVDPTTMKYDEIAMNNDIATYGLFTYEEFNSLIPIEEEMFDAFNGQYLKVAIGKGLIDMDELEMLVERYEEYLIG